MTDQFTTIRTEGGLLPPDLLQTIAARATDSRSKTAAGSAEPLDGLKPADYGLPEQRRLGAAIAEAWNNVKAYWAAFQAAKARLGSDRGVTTTRNLWLLPLLGELGYDEATVAYQPAATVVGERRYRITHRHEGLPLVLISWQQDLDAAEGTEGRRISPHALLQEYLNVSEATWGIVSNGLKLRLLRDNAALTRQAFVEWDLETMLETGAYADFVLLYLVLHRSRLPRPGDERPCWLDRWREQSDQLGARALDRLRSGVERAIEALGTGFLAHPENVRLRERLRTGELPAEAYYQQLLRLVYRLLFLFVAEERGLLFTADADERDRKRFLESYGAGRLREAARKERTNHRHDDLWRSLRVTFDLLAGERRGLGVAAVGGGLFDDESCPDIDGTRPAPGQPRAFPATIANAYLAEAVLHLSYVRIETGRGRSVVRRVNYRDMDTEELGGVYEGLLEQQPRLAAGEHFQRFELVKSSSRKQTGSYYTPPPLVAELIRSALEPVIADRLAGLRDRERRRQTILGITVCDPACGSGHFLLAAARRLAQELASIDAGDREPTPAEYRRALREVIRRCVYGVDLNPLAVDLCKLALWLEGHEPGKPLTFLDHHIRLGNSLVGATRALIAKGIPDGAFDPVTGDVKAIADQAKRANRDSRSKERPLAQYSMAAALDREERARRTLSELESLPQDSLDDYERLRRALLEYEGGPGEQERLRFDAWAAAFYWPLTPDAAPPPTSSALAVDPPDITAEQLAKVRELRRAHHFFHWELAFPRIFPDDQRGGFDCVLGNPPWERIKLQEKEFFAGKDDEIANAPNAAVRKRKIAALETKSPALFQRYREALRGAECASKLVRLSGRFPLTGRGDVNLYSVFAELDRNLLNAQGRAGVIVPTGIATDDSTKHFFQSVAEGGQLATLFDFENRERIFPAVDSRMKFCLLTLAGGRIERGDLAFFLTATGQLSDERRRFQLSAEDFSLLNPNTRTCPVFRTAYDAELTKAIYRRVPVLVNEVTGENPWGIQFLRMFDMSNDSHLFKTAPAPGLVPLYEAKLFHQYNHRWATYEDAESKGEPDVRDATLAELADPNWQVRPRYWVERDEVERRLAGRWDRQWLIAFRDVARATDERTAIFSVLPRVGVGNKAPIVLPGVQGPHLAALLANLNALVFDFCTRQKKGGTSLNFFILKQLPVLPPSAYEQPDLEFIVQHVAELVLTASDVHHFATDIGAELPSASWDTDRRAIIRAELDAYFASHYGLTRDELRYILDPQDVFGPDFPGETFRVLKEREIREYGEYRTRRLVLEAWDRLGLQPRNRDGRYSVDPGKAQANGGDRSMPPTIRTTVSTNAQGASDEGRTGPASSPAPGTSPASTSTAVPAKTTSGATTPARGAGLASQAMLPGLQPLESWQQAASPPPPVAPVNPTPASATGGLDKERRQRILRAARVVLTAHGTLRTSDLVGRLRRMGVDADEQTVQAVLCTDGRQQFIFDEQRGTFRCR